MDEVGHGEAAAREEEAGRLIQSGEWPAVRIEFYREWGGIFPHEAIRHARANNPGASTVCVSSVLEGWVAKDPLAAVSWTSAQDGNAERSIWMGKVAGIWPADRLDQLAAPVASLAGSPSGRMALDSYARRLMADDPSKAFSWMHGSITDRDLSSGAIVSVMGDWASEETEKASGWLANVGREVPWRDDAIIGLVSGVISLDHETARQWVHSMVDEKARKGMIDWLEGKGESPAKSVP